MIATPKSVFVSRQHPFFFIFIILASSINAIDPWTGFLREFALNTKTSIQNFIGQTTSNIGSLQQLDNLVPTPCPLCRQFPGVAFSGRWRISHMSRSFRLQTFTELDILIDRTRSGQLFSQRRTFQELATDPPEPICPTLTVLLDPIDGQTGKWELAYGMPPDGQLKSIIGIWEGSPLLEGTNILWQIGSLRVAQFCIALASSTFPWTNSSSQLATSGSGDASSFPMPPSLQFNISIPSNRSNFSSSTPQFVLLNQVDGWPNCGNFLVLTKGMNAADENRLRDWLESKRIEGPMNRLERTRCEES